MPFSQQDTFWMQHAIKLAEFAALQGEVPVGAVLILENQLIGEGSNRPIAKHDPTAHAEIIALRAGAQHLQNYRLPNATLYVTLEPCVMCVGALVHGRVQRVVYGAADPKSGAVHSVFSLADVAGFNHRITYEGGLLADQCGQLLKDFFQARR